MYQHKREIICEDGSKTLYSPLFNEPYHSTKDGAFHESLQKYVVPTVTKKATNPKIVILDICYGLGYNVLSTIYYILRQNLKIKVHFISVEFDIELIESLKDFDYPSEFDAISHIIDSISANQYFKDDQFEIEILLGDARKTIPTITQKVDIIYQDAFSPANNPLLWTKEHFATLRRLSKEDTLLATYSTAASVRLGLYENGFLIYTISHELARLSTVASPQHIAEFDFIDMELKKLRNQISVSLRDSDYTDKCLEEKSILR